jgi:hypothetical protein
MTKSPDIKKPKDKEAEIDFTNVTADDIARRVLATPPMPKKKEKKKEKNS